MAALNEGWEPQFIPGEYSWAPFFTLHTQENIDEMDEATKARVVYRPNSSVDAFVGVSYTCSNYGSAFARVIFASQLAFKSEELAEYAGKQFVNIYADFLLLGCESEK